MNYLDYIKDLVDNSEELCGHLDIDFNRETQQIKVTKKQVLDKGNEKVFHTTDVD